MKKHFTKNILRICIVLLAISFTNESQAQTIDPELSTTVTQEVVTQLNDDLSIILNIKLPVSETYTVDVKHFESNMPDQQAADVFINQYDRQDVDVEVDLNTLIATIKLTFTATNTDWTVEQWNEYLKN